MMHLKFSITIAFLVIGSASFAQSNDQSELIGRNVSELEFFDSDGKTVKLASFKGSYLYVDFWHSHWASTCECIEQIPTGNQLMNEEKIEDFRMINISLDPSEQHWKEKGYASKISGLSNNLWIGPWSRFETMDQMNEFTEKWNLRMVPQYWIVDHHGNILEVGKPKFR